MNNGQNNSVDAIVEVVYRNEYGGEYGGGRIEDPNVQPGMIVKYRWDEPVRISPNQLSSADRQILADLENHRVERERYGGYGASLYKNRIDELLTRNEEREAEAFVAKVVLQGRYWMAYLDGFPEPVPTNKLKPIRVAEVPAIPSNTTYEIKVPQHKPLEGIIRLLNKNYGSSKRVLARVLTQSALEPNSMVYLSNPTGGEVYAVSSASLTGTEYKRDFVKPEMQETKTTSPSEMDTILKEQEQRELKHQQRLRRKAEERIQQTGPQTYSPPPIPSQGYKKPQTNQTKYQGRFSEPAEIANELNQVVRGQEEAVRSVAIAVYDHSVRPEGVKKSNILIVGPTGTGKTELSKQVSELLGVPFAEAKLGGKSSTGYKGDNLATVFEELYPHRSHSYVGRAVLFLDEIDKLAEQHFSSGAGFGGALQNELIGWVEEADINAPIGLHTTFRINTKDMLFIAAGAFVGLENIIAERLGITIPDYNGADRRQIMSSMYSELKPDDLERFGLKPELIGRFPVITYTKPLDINALIDITKNGKKSAFNQQLHLLQEGYGLSVVVDEEVYSILATSAQNLGTGARGLETVSNRLFEDIKFNITQLTRGRNSLQITPEMAVERLKKYLPEDYKF